MPVYMLQAGAFGDTKIGVAIDPLARMKQLQTSMPKKLRLVRVLEGGHAEERALHERFSADRLSGEWFRLSATAQASDLGLRDLPIPQSKRTRLNDMATAEGRWRQLQEDLVEIIGGEEILARALCASPWGMKYSVRPKYLSAVIVLARQAGAPTSYDEARAVMRAALKDYRSNTKANKRRERQHWRREFEKKWVSEHGPAGAWWLPDLPAPAEDPNAEAAA